MALQVYLGVKKNDKIKDVYTGEITHTLSLIAKKVGMYEAIWRPYLLKRNKFINSDEESDFEANTDIKAYELIPILENGLDTLKTHITAFKRFEATDGKGTQKQLIDFTSEYLEACKKNKQALVAVSR